MPKLFSDEVMRQFVHAGRLNKTKPVCSHCKFSRVLDTGTGKKLHCTSLNMLARFADDQEAFQRMVAEDQFACLRYERKSN